MDERGNVYALRGIPPYFILDSPHRSRISISRAYRRISSQGKQRIARSRIPRNPVRREFRPTRRSVGEREGGEGGGRDETSRTTLLALQHSRSFRELDDHHPPRGLPSGFTSPSYRMHSALHTGPNDPDCFRISFACPYDAPALIFIPRVNARGHAGSLIKPERRA
jgi:hypothetical protein